MTPPHRASERAHAPLTLLRLLRLATGLAAAIVLGACSEETAVEPPQIVPQQSPYYLLGQVPVVGATAEAEAALSVTRTFTIQFADGGGQPLHLTRARVLGDTRCSFSQPRILRAAATPSGPSAVVLLGYRPGSVGADDVTLEIVSNAERSPTLELTLCGDAYDPAATPEAPAPRTACADVASDELNPACDATPEGEGN